MFHNKSDPLKSGTDLPQLSYAIRDDKWLPFTAERNSFKFLDTNIKGSVAFGPPRPDYCEFWNSYLPKFRAKSKWTQPVGFCSVCNQFTRPSMQQIKLNGYHFYLFRTSCLYSNSLSILNPQLKNENCVTRQSRASI